jgi:transaldolase
VNGRLKELSEIGQSVWIDYLSREMVRGGHLQRLVEEGVVGVTSNPTIFQKAISGSELYDEQLRELARSGVSPKEAFLELARVDVREACDLLRPVYERTGHRDGFVSLEVSPDLAYDTEATVEEAARLHELVDRENLMVKIPATREGLPAIEEMISRGRSINVTLIFSLERYRAVTQAYLRGIERLVDSGGDPSKVASVASFFVSRVDTEADRRLDEIGGHDELKGRLAVANAKLAYQVFKETFAGPEWEELEARGARRQRPLWASTSTKNPDYPDTLYVDELIGPETVNTMPEETLEAFKDHGTVRPALEEGLEEAREVFRRVREAGVDYEDVTEVLEREGVQKFADSYHELLREIERETSRAAS